MDEYEDVKNILTQWDLSEYIPKFVENKITLETFGLLDSALIKELIGPVGHRARFSKNLNQWNALTNSLQDEPSMSSDIDILQSKHKKIYNISNLEETLSKSPSPIKSKESTPDFSISWLLSDPSTVQNLSETPPNFKYTKLKDLLNNSLDGKRLINLHAESGLLSSNSRRKICNIIIKHILDVDLESRISSSILLDYAQQITEIFQKENISTYFVPYLSNTKLKIKRLAKGKLYDCLQNRRREYREALLNKSKEDIEIDTQRVTQRVLFHAYRPCAHLRSHILST